MRSCVESRRMGPTGITGLPCEPRTSSGISADPRRRRPFSTAWPQRQNPRRSAPSVAAQASIAFSRSQQRKRSLYAAALAAQLANECGGLCTPALKNPADQPLTDRQREIIELAAAGLSNKEIADCV